MSKNHRYMHLLFFVKKQQLINPCLFIFHIYIFEYVIKNLKKFITVVSNGIRCMLTVTSSMSDGYSKRF